MVKFIDDERKSMGSSRFAESCQSPHPPTIVSKTSKRTQKNKAVASKATNTLWSKSNRFGETVAVAMAFVKSGTNSNKTVYQSLLAVLLKGSWNSLASKAYGGAKAKSPPNSVMTKTNPLIWSNAILLPMPQTRKDSCGAVLLRSLTLPISRLKQARFTPPLSLMCLNGSSSVGKYPIAWIPNWYLMR